MSYRVQVTERRTQQLAGVSDCQYRSPELGADAARELLRVLLGREPERACTRWSQPVAGGRRHVELVEVSR